jgi:hypothetical protein
MHDHSSKHDRTDRYRRFNELRPNRVMRGSILPDCGHAVTSVTSCSTYRSRKNDLVTLAQATWWHWLGKGHVDDFVSGDGSRNLSRDGDRFRTRPDLANSV